MSGNTYLCVFLSSLLRGRASISVFAPLFVFALRDSLAELVGLTVHTANQLMEYQKDVAVCCWAVAPLSLQRQRYFGLGDPVAPRLHPMTGCSDSRRIVHPPSSGGVALACGASDSCSSIQCVIGAYR